MKMVCANCDLGLKRSDCSDREYIECECRRWMIESMRRETLNGFMHILNEALEEVYENKNDLNRNKIRMSIYLSESSLE